MYILFLLILFISKIMTFYHTFYSAACFLLLKNLSWIALQIDRDKNLFSIF